MKYLFSSDSHYGHFNIIRYTNRPYETLEQMNGDLIKRWNDRVKPDDMVFHLGDFCFRNTKGAAPRGEGGVEGWLHWWDQLNGIKILTNGNHDRNNSAKAPIKYAVLELGGHRIGICHRPVDACHFFDKAGVGLVLCGHVHNNWSAKNVKLTQGITPFINVGVDVRNFYPMTLEEVLAEYSKMRKNKDFVESGVFTQHENQKRVRE